MCCHFLSNFIHYKSTTTVDMDYHFEMTLQNIHSLYHHLMCQRPNYNTMIGNDLRKSLRFIY